MKRNLIFLIVLLFIVVKGFAYLSETEILNKVYDENSTSLKVVSSQESSKTYASLQGKKTVSGTISSTNTVAGVFIQVKGGKCDFHFSWNETPNDLTLEDGEGFEVKLPTPYKSNGDFLYFTLTSGATLQYYIDLLK